MAPRDVRVCVTVCVHVEYDFMVCQAWIIAVNSRPISGKTNANVASQSSLSPLAEPTQQRKSHKTFFRVGSCSAFSLPPHRLISLSVKMSSASSDSRVMLLRSVSRDIHPDRDTDTHTDVVLWRHKRKVYGRGGKKTKNKMCSFPGSWNSGRVHTDVHGAFQVKRHSPRHQLLRIIYAVSNCISWEVRRRGGEAGGRKRRRRRGQSVMFRRKKERERDFLDRYQGMEGCLRAQWPNV